jgi:hypothetical protein
MIYSDEINQINKRETVFQKKKWKTQDEMVR